MEKFDNNLYSKFQKLCSDAVNSLNKGGKIISFGNGGSAADSMHFTAELVGKFKKIRQSYNAICLNENQSVITCIANDFSFDHIFVRQLEGIFSENDLVIMLSTSGNSKNIIESSKFLNLHNYNYFILTGKDGGEINNLSNNLIKVPSSSVDEIQEFHYMLLHVLSDYIEKEIG